MSEKQQSEVGQLSLGSLEEELHDSLQMKQSESLNTHLQQQIPDGGLRAWMVCLTASLTIGTIFSILNSFGVMFTAFEREYMDPSDERKSLKASSVWSLATGLAFGLSPVASILIDRFGIRQMSFLGGALAFSGMLLTSFVSSYRMVYLTYGVMFGCGISFMNTASVVILGHYFKRRLGRANGLVMAGSSCFLIAAPYFHKLMIQHLGLRHDFHILSGLLAMFMVYASVWKPTFSSALQTAVVHSKRSKEADSIRLEKMKEALNKIVRFDNLRNRNYVIWMTAMVICNFSYFISFVHLVKYVEIKNANFDGPALLTVQSIGSLLSRIVCGSIADHPRICRISMLQMSFATMGSCLCIFPLVNSYIGLGCLVFIFGLCDGNRITLMGPIAVDIVGLQGVSQAVGLLMGLSAIPFMSGPSITGFLYDRLGTFDISYYVAGIPPLFAANLMFFIQKPHQVITSLI